MIDVFVIGVGMTRFGRLPERSIKSLVEEATQAALKDAGVRKEHLQAAFFANATQGHMDGQHMIRGQLALRAMGIQSIPVFNVENACASGSSAFSLAVNHLRAGAGEVALAIGAEKMFTADRQRMLSSFDSALDVSCAPAVLAALLELGVGVEAPAGSRSANSYSVFMDVYGAFARAHMARFGTTQRQIAAVSAKNHRHSVHNPLAQYQTPFSVQEVLAAPPITYPLTLPMCSPVSDGAAAAIICTRSAMQRLGLDPRRAIRVMSSVVQTGSDRHPDDLSRHLTVLAARRAYEEAGIGPEDLSLAEVHDATAMGEIIQTENLGLCAVGEGGSLAEKGDTTIGGRIPVNPSGGLESKGHPVGATGIAQIYELVTQLRAEAGPRQVDNARFAVAENGGGVHGVEEAVACVTVLGAR